jgi:hypothetical protein
MEFLTWENNRFKPIYKGGWIPNWSFNFFKTLDKLYINDIDNDGYEDVLIFEPGIPDDYILHWERKPFSLGLKEFSASPGSSYVDITVRLEEPRTDVGLNVYRHLANNIVAEYYYTLESLNAQPLIGDTVFTLRDHVKIKGMPYHYFLVADDYDGCPSVYGPIYGNSFGNLQEPVLMFEVFNDAAPETLAVIIPRVSNRIWLDL